MTMQCREVRELADSFLSEQLLVETNHEIVRHLETCPDCRADISRKPSEYLKKFYYDCVNFDPKAVRLCVDFAGAGQVMAASDYPHQIGSIPKMKSSLAALDVSDKERQMILGENARTLYKL